MATITTMYKGDMLFESQLGSHRLQIDVPPAMGGKDRAPTPPELFIASLGSCVAAFVADHCGRAGVNTEGLSVSVSFDKVENPTRLINLKVQVHLPWGKCNDLRLKAIRRVAEHCPVHETVLTLKEIDIEIVGAEAEPVGP